MNPKTEEENEAMDVDESEQEQSAGQAEQVSQNEPEWKAPTADEMRSILIMDVNLYIA